ncbi:MAG TPA: autotransporter outer membrane beta-barrel domain-containing protein, partial [Candidatus Limnocylindrales bacterium]|nr:autotransporter outer membrane beta-barrel domain-containing protein [Candidatus Limnocylindrales bacterium]
MRTFRRAGAVLAVALAILSPAAPAAAGELVRVPGLTGPQGSMAAAIDIVCPKLLAAGFATQDSGAGDLTRRCREMRQSANANQASGASTFSLGLSNEALANVLGLLAHEEATVQGTGAIETGASATRAVAGRLRALRQGARGINVSGLSLPVDGRFVSVGDLVGIDGAAGGGADPGGFGRWGGFLNGAYSFGDKDGTERESGFDFQSGLVTAGVDYRLTDAFVAGLALSYTRSDADIDGNLGDVDTDSYGISLYGTAYWGGFYLDTLVGFTWNTYDMTRRISYAAGPGAGGGAAGVVVDRTARADTDAPQVTASLGFGYEFRPAGFVVSPFLRTEFVGLLIDSYTERGAGGLDLHVKRQDVFSLQHALGAQVAYPFSLPFGVLTPYVRAEWRHEYLDNKRRV